MWSRLVPLRCSSATNTPLEQERKLFLFLKLPCHKNPGDSGYSGASHMSRYSSDPQPRPRPPLTNTQLVPANNANHTRESVYPIYKPNNDPLRHFWRTSVQDDRATWAQTFRRFDMIVSDSSQTSVQGHRALWNEEGQRREKGTMNKRKKRKTWKNPVVSPSTSWKWKRGKIKVAAPSLTVAQVWSRMARYTKQLDEKGRRVWRQRTWHIELAAGRNSECSLCWKKKHKGEKQKALVWII